jgi:hypothetical protein
MDDITVVVIFVDKRLILANLMGEVEVREEI